MITTDFAPIKGPGLDNFGFPADVALFAIGDVHGQAQALRDLCAGIAATDTGARKRHVAFLGDAIDRGPASIEVIEMLQNLAQITRADEVTLLPGNHELMMADVLSGAICTKSGIMLTQTWVANGGLEVLLEVLGHLPEADVLHNIRREFRQAMSRDDALRALHKNLFAVVDILPLFLKVLRGRGIDPVAWVRAMPSHLRIGSVVCVHAGVDPKLYLTSTLELTQEEHFIAETHWAWVREPFLAHQGGWFEEGFSDSPGFTDGHLVIHGHTVPKKWDRHAGADPDRIARIFDRTETNARICVDFGSASGKGVGACLITDEGRQLMYAPCKAPASETQDTAAVDATADIHE